MNKKEYEKEMVRIIKLVRDSEGNSLQNALQALSIESNECLATCVDKGYIIGIPYQRNLEGNPLFGMVNPKVTLKGHEYLNPPAKNILAIIALILSGLALLVSFFSNYSAIATSIQTLFS